MRSQELMTIMGNEASDGGIWYVDDDNTSHG